MSATAPGYVERLWFNFQVYHALCGWRVAGSWPQESCIQLVFLSVFSAYLNGALADLIALSDWWVLVHYGLLCW